MANRLSPEQRAFEREAATSRRSLGWKLGGALLACVAFVATVVPILNFFGITHFQDLLPHSHPAKTSPAPTVPVTLAVYTDSNAAANQYFLSLPTSDNAANTGDSAAVTANDDWTQHPHSGGSCIKVTYSGQPTQGHGWAAIYWLAPINNFGTQVGGGHDLRHYTHLSFWAHGEKGSEHLTFGVGGLSGSAGDSLVNPVTTDAILTTTWQQFTIDLTGQDLSHIVAGFRVTMTQEGNPNGATFYLDDIFYTA